MGGVASTGMLSVLHDDKEYDLIISKRYITMLQVKHLEGSKPDKIASKSFME